MLDESLKLAIARLQNSGAKAESDSAGEEPPPPTESHFNRLFNLLKKLRAINDRADSANSAAPHSSQDFDLLVIAALREAECADLIEKSMEADLTSLCSELKRKEEALQAREMELGRLRQASEARLAELESRIQKQEEQLQHLETARQKLTSERDHLATSLNEAERAARRTDAEARQLKERMETELSALRLPTAKGEPWPEGSRPERHRAEEEPLKEIEALQLRLQEMEAKAASQERELKEKDATIHAAGVRETELGTLIERLSSECTKLSAELCEKQLTPPRFEDKGRSALISGGKAWGKIFQRARVGRASSDKNKPT